MRFSLCAAVCLTIASVCGNAAGAASRAELDQLVQQVQAKPGDTALRERVIKMAQELKPAPAVPEEARAAFVEGSTILKAAGDATQQKLAVQSFQAALKIAPWWGDAYYNLAVAQELAGEFASARASLRLYLLTKPGEKEAREAQDRIYALNARIKLAQAKPVKPTPASSSASSTAVAPAVDPAADEKKLAASLEGAIWLSQNVIDADGACANAGCTQQTTMHHRAGYIVRGGQLVTLYVQWLDGQSEPPANLAKLEWSESIMKPIPVTGRQLTGHNPGYGALSFVISDDSRTLTETHSMGTFVFVRAN